jgi:hypothetical protein
MAKKYKPIPAVPFDVLIKATKASMKIMKNMAPQSLPFHSSASFAARAPLFEAKTVGDVSFDHGAFMKIALEESETDGTA